jgi:hypothetical protein
MTTDDKSNFSDNDPALSEERKRAVDELGHRAGAALRRPAPPHGLAGIMHHARNQRVMRSGIAVAGVAALVIVGVAVLRGGDDEQNRVISTNTVQTTTPTTPPTSAVAADTSSDVLAVNAEVRQLLEDYRAAWNNYDGAAFTALVTDGYRLTAPGTDTNAIEQAQEISNYLAPINWHATQLGDSIMVGDGPWLVASANHVTWTNADGTADFGDGIITVTVVDVDGQLLISRQEVTWAP